MEPGAGDPYGQWFCLRILAVLPAADDVIGLAVCGILEGILQHSGGSRNGSGVLLIWVKMNPDLPSRSHFLLVNHNSVCLATTPPADPD